MRGARTLGWPQLGDERGGAGVSEDEMRRAALAGHTALDAIEPFLDTLDGMVAATVRRGFTQEQARSLVAYMFGHRPAENGDAG